MRDIDAFVTASGDTITLRSDSTCWELVNCNPDGEIIWTETSVTGAHPFTEEEARAEFNRWRG
jgi:hypothetical protein